MVKSAMETAAYRVTDHLIRLAHGSDELLLVNAFSLLPLYVRKGGGYIASLVEYLGRRSRTRKEILKDYPGDEALVDFLLAHDILIPADSREAASPRVVLPDMKERKTDGMSAYFLLTQSCSFSCIYCLNGRETYRKNDNLTMPKEVAFRALDTFAARIKDDGRLEVVLFGGEPLLNWGLAKEIILYCEKTVKPRHPLLHVHYHATTNLGMLPKDFAQWAKDYRISVLCDVDGIREVHDVHRPFKDGRPSFDRICRHIDQLVAAGISVSLRTTVTGMNDKQVLATTRLHKRMGGAGSAFVPVNIVNSDGEILPDALIPSVDRLCASVQELYDCNEWELSRLFPFSSFSGNIAPGHRCVVGCGAPYGNTPVVDVNGDVYPCIYLVGMPAYRVGNIMDGTYPQTSVLQEMGDELHVDRRADCKGCNWRYLCGGGCPDQRLIVKGREEELSPRARDYCENLTCDYTRKILTILLWEAAQRADADFRSGITPTDGPAPRDTKIC